MLSISFPVLLPLPGKTQIRTQLPTTMDSKSTPTGTGLQPGSWDSLWKSLVSWSLLLHGEWLDMQDTASDLNGSASFPRSPNGPSSPPPPTSLLLSGHSPGQNTAIDLDSAFLWGTLIELLKLLDACPAQAISTDLRSILVGGQIRVHKREIVGRNAQPLLGRLALVDGLARLALFAHAQRKPQQQLKKPTTVTFGGSQAAMSELHIRLARLEAINGAREEHPDLARRVSELEGQVRAQVQLGSNPPKSDPMITPSLSLQSPTFEPLPSPAHDSHASNSLSAS